jgi:hypothetical protein
MELTKTETNKLQKIQQDLDLIKEILFYNKNIKDPEGELSDWAKKELMEARETSEDEYVDSEDIEKEFL